jgi:putative ABC transport system ATP-binding protein
MIQLRNVSKSYDTAAGAFTALRNLDLDVAAGELVAIVGRSGSGKSTLLNVLGGIDTPSTGTVTIAGAAIGSLGESRLAAWRGRTVGFVFQFFQLLPTLTVAENVMLPMDFCRRFPARERRARAMELLDRFGVARQADKLPASLSGGEQQRVAIARALAPRPSLILADEPTGNLDLATGGEVMDLLFGLKDRTGATLLLITHDRTLAKRCDRIVSLADGRIVSAGAKRKVAAS